MFDENKLEAIREYLKAEFNTTEITDREDSKRETQTFRINDSKNIYIVKIAREFIEDNDASSISSILKREAFKKIFETDKIRALYYAGPGMYGYIHEV